MSILVENKEAGQANSKVQRLKQLYKWHRIIGLMTVIPVIFWTFSGLMHPFMAHWFKPEIPKTFLVPRPVPLDKITLEPREVLETAGLDQIRMIRLVQWNEGVFYQVESTEGKMIYLDAQTGNRVENGDQAYAEYLARTFLEDQQSPVKSASLLTQFDGQYKYINRLLPVWQLDFDREDDMTIYVETSSDRLGTFNPTSRKAFIWFFSVFHNWSWLEAISSTWVRTTVMLILLGIIVSSAVSGLVIYGFFWKRFKSPTPANSQGILRKYHRQIGLMTAFVTLTFAFSGAYQATSKYTPDVLPEMVEKPLISTADLGIGLTDLNFPKEALINFGLVRMNTKTYYQVRQSLGKDKGATWEYYETSTGQHLNDGDRVYATYLANLFESKLGLDLGSELKEEGKELTAFDHEYGFVFKRLPVQKLAFDTDSKNTLYIETGTSRLAASIADSDRARGLSFAVLHKYFLLDWAGKNIRDGVMMLSALGVLVVTLFGLAIFIKR